MSDGRIRIQQRREGPNGPVVVLRIEGDAVKVKEPDGGIAIWDKPTVGDV